MEGQRGPRPTTRRCEEQGREAAKSLFTPPSPGHQTAPADDQHRPVGMLGRKPGRNRENACFTDGKVKGIRKISVPQMTPYLRTQLSTLSTFWVLAPELLFPAENGTSTSISCMTAGERGQEHERQEETGTWLWIPSSHQAPLLTHAQDLTGVLRDLEWLRWLCRHHPACGHPHGHRAPLGVWGWPQTQPCLPGEDFLADSAQAPFHHRSAARSLPWAQDHGNCCVSLISCLLRFFCSGFAPCLPQVLQHLPISVRLWRPRAELFLA